MPEDDKKIAPKQEPKQRQEQKPEAVKRFVYVGPTLREGLAQFSVWKGGIPKKYEKYFETNPEFKTLFVDLETIVTAKDDVEVPGTELNAAYRTIKEKGVI